MVRAGGGGAGGDRAVRVGSRGYDTSLTFDISVSYDDTYETQTHIARLLWPLRSSRSQRGQSLRKSLRLWRIFSESERHIRSFRTCMRPASYRQNELW